MSGALAAKGTCRTGAAGRGKIEFKLPEITRADFLEGRLAVFKGGKKILDQALWLFPPNMFAGSVNVIKEHNVQLSLGEKGEILEKLFRKLKIPYSTVPGGVDTAEPGILIECGIDFEERSSNAEVYLDLLERGVNIVVIPPVTGSIAIPLKGCGKLKFSAVSPHLRTGGKVLKKLRVFSGKCFKFECDGDEPEIKVSLGKGAGFSWIFAEYPKAEIVLVSCDLAREAASNPAAALLLKNILVKYGFKKQKIGKGVEE